MPAYAVAVGARVRTFPPRPVPTGRRASAPERTAACHVHEGYEAGVARGVAERGGEDVGCLRVIPYLEAREHRCETNKKRGCKTLDSRHFRTVREDEGEDGVR